MKIRLFIFILLAFHTMYGYAQINQVRELIENYRYREAIKLLEVSPQSIDNLLLMADCYQQVNDYSPALRIYDSLSVCYPENRNILMAGAECAYQSGNADLSLAYWQKMNALSPDNLFLQTRLAVAYYRAGDWHGTIRATDEVFKQDSIPMLLRMAGDAHIYLNDGVGLVYYMKAIEKDPADHLALRNLCDFYYSIQLYDTVVMLTDRYLSGINPDHKSIGQLNGMALYSSGEYRKAIERLRRNVELKDSSYTTTYFLGMSYYASKLYFDATKWLDIAYGKATPEPDVNLLYYYGTALSRTFDRKKGIEILNEGVGKIEKIGEMLFDYEVSLAVAHQRSKLLSKAIGYYQSAFKRRPQTHSILYNIASVYDEMEDMEGALSYYERFLKTAPAEFNVNGEPVAQSELEKLTSSELYYRAAAQRVAELQKKRFFDQRKQ
ncbi:MAG: tetratricopeptide repeat protein [Porphyromonadaceae bacterium]|nr:tetratricopeptide repeat protein [Porphyromonadaceae bacterium]